MLYISHCFLFFFLIYFLHCSQTNLFRVLLKFNCLLAQRFVINESVQQLPAARESAAQRALQSAQAAPLSAAYDECVSQTGLKLEF